MYCTSCGIEISEAFRFCPQCGRSSGSKEVISQAVSSKERLQRSRQKAKVAGVCSGLARYLGVDPTLIRLLAVLLALYPPGLGVLFYVVCWIVIPREPLLLPAARPSSGQPVAVR